MNNNERLESAYISRRKQTEQLENPEHPDDPMNVIHLSCVLHISEKSKHSEQPWIYEARALNGRYPNGVYVNNFIYITPKGQANESITDKLLDGEIGEIDRRLYKLGQSMHSVKTSNRQFRLQQSRNERKLHLGGICVSNSC